jgi:alpha-glucosidase
MTTRRRALACSLSLAAVLLAAAPVRAAWSSLGAMPAPRREGGTLVFRDGKAVVSVSVLTPEVVRVRYSPTPAFGRDHSYAVIAPERGDAGARFEVGPARSVIGTRALTVTVTHDPFRVAFADAAGESLDQDDAQRGMAAAGTAVRAWKRLREDEHVYGFGEKGGRLDKRGPYMGGSSFAMWNSDTYAYGEDTDPLYVSVPFYLVLRKGKAHGIFLDNTFRTSFDVGKESPDLLSFGALDGELDYYFIHGPSPREVVERYTALTGRMPLPPRWALGYNQCRYSYYPESRVRLLADNFRVKRVPADVIWLDIHYQDGYKPFTWDKARFPDPGRLIADLRRQGFRVVTIVDPHPKKERGYAPYDSGLAGGHFIKNPDGTVYEAPVWPSQAERDPGPSVFPDFSRPATRDWWGGLYREFLDLGVAGIWNDMNEPAVFVEPWHTMDLNARHDNEGQPTDHREIHNVYGLLNSRATFEGLARLRPNARPFVLTRATYAGGQRWAALWPGDNTSDWNHLRATVPMFSNLGLSGFSFVGADIGGFADAPSPELFTRWLQVGVFYPFMRTHTTFGTPEQEPWSYGLYHEELNRRAIELRYELLPHVYNLMRESSDTGAPAFRPLLYEFPQDEATYRRDDEFMLGRDLLIAPVLREGVREREVYLPAGEWFDFWTGRAYAGGKGHRLPVTLESIPVFVRGGGFVFRQPVVQHTGEMAGQPLRVTVFPAAQSEAVFYEDDGETRDHERGVYARRRFSQRREGSSVSVEAGAVEGSYRPAARDLVLEIRYDGAPRRVLLDGAALPADGWTAADGFVRVKLRDRPAAIKVALEG